MSSAKWRPYCLGLNMMILYTVDYFTVSVKHPLNISNNADRERPLTWWRHQMEIFSALLAPCEGNTPVTGEFPSQRPVTRGFDFFLWSALWIKGWGNDRDASYLRRLRAHYSSLWRHCNNADRERPLTNGMYRVPQTDQLAGVFTIIWAVVDDNVNGDDNVAGVKGNNDSCQLHDNVIKWKHFPRYWPYVRGIHRSPVNSPHKSKWRGALVFYLICAWANGWVNNRDAGDLARSWRWRHCNVNSGLFEKSPIQFSALETWTLWPLGDAACALVHLPLDKMAAISQTTYSNAFSWMKNFVFWCNFTEVCS